MTPYPTDDDIPDVVPKTDKQGKRKPPGAASAVSAEYKPVEGWDHPLEEKYQYYEKEEPQETMENGLYFYYNGNTYQLDEPMGLPPMTIRDMRVAHTLLEFALVRIRKEGIHE